MEIWKKLNTTIKANDTIIIHRHILPDGDAIGSQLALKQLINLNFPNKKGLFSLYVQLEFYHINDEKKPTYGFLPTFF